MTFWTITSSHKDADCHTGCYCIIHLLAVAYIIGLLFCFYYIGTGKAVLWPLIDLKRKISGMVWLGSQTMVKSGSVDVRICRCRNTVRARGMDGVKIRLRSRVRDKVRVRNRARRWLI